MGYAHTQRGSWYWLLFGIAAACLAGAWSWRVEVAVHYTLLGAALLLIVIGTSFMQLTIRDEQDALGIRFGPLPLFFTRIAYGRIRSVEPDRTTLLDGWGIHYLPGRGTTYNIWGFQCVRVELDHRTLRIGTDDVENLVKLLRERMPRSDPFDRSESGQQFGTPP